MNLKVSRSAVIALVGLLAVGAVVGVWLGTSDEGGEQAEAPSAPSADSGADAGSAPADDASLSGGEVADAGDAMSNPGGSSGSPDVDAVLAGGELSAEQDLTIPRIGIEDAVLLLGSEDVVWVDTRTAGEFAEGHIEGAISIPAYEQDMALTELPQDKEIIVYCA